MKQQKSNNRVLFSDFDCTFKGLKQNNLFFTKLFYFFYYHFIFYSLFNPAVKSITINYDICTLI